VEEQEELEIVMKAVAEVAEPGIAVMGAMETMETMAHTMGVPVERISAATVVLEEMTGQEEMVLHMVAVVALPEMMEVAVAMEQVVQLFLPGSQTLPLQLELLLFQIRQCVQVAQR